MWISIGGFIFFGAYEATKEQLNARDASPGDEGQQSSLTHELNA